MNPNKTTQAIMHDLLQHYTTKEVSDRIGVTRHCVNRWANGGNISNSNFVSLVRLHQQLPTRTAETVAEAPPKPKPPQLPTPAANSAKTAHRQPEGKRYTVTGSYTVNAASANEAIMEALALAEQANISWTNLGVEVRERSP